MGKRLGIVLGIVVAALVGLRLVIGDLGIRGIIFQQAFPTDYFEPYNTFPPTLEPIEIVGHTDVNASLDDWPHAAQIARVDVPVDGDVDMMLGSVRVRLLYMPRSHSTTLYGFHFPDTGVVFAPDTMFVKAMPPFGFPDWYYPGYIRALDRLIELNAAHYVPSHFDNGGRADLIDYRNMMVDFRDTVTAGLAKYDYDAANGANLRAVFAEVYPVLRDRYGHWHGFEAMFVPHFGGQAGGTYLGF